MMPSVIPARLQFQCGHAALVTLPRVKGETATQRNDRVAREKTAALARQCDFCAPSVAVMEPQLAVVNGNHVEIAQSDVVEPTPVAELAVVVTNAFEPTVEVEVTSLEIEVDTETEWEPTPVEPVVWDVVAIEPEPAEPEVIVEEIIIVEEIEEIPAASEPKPARKPRARRQPAPATPARARRAPARRATPARARVARRQAYRVEYRAERVIRATSIQDALRQAAALGAGDVLAISRED